MSRVVDASVVVAALIDAGPVGRWAESMLSGDDLCAPHLMPVEVANVLRRNEDAATISSDAASLAHVDLADRAISLYPYQPLARRIWELRSNITCYDAWYVALAESLGSTLATLDVRLAKATGTRCDFETPPVETPPGARS